jgi:hypothetical protein
VLAGENEFFSAASGSFFGVFIPFALLEALLSAIRRFINSFR